MERATRRLFFAIGVGMTSWVPHFFGFREAAIVFTVLAAIFLALGVDGWRD